MRLIYSTRWDSDPTRTWSGTTWHLRKALSRHYEVIDYKIPGNDCLSQAAHRFLRIFEGNDLDLGSIDYGNQKFWKTFQSQPGDVVFQFDECPRPIAFSGLRHYIYLDNCVEFLVRSVVENDPISAYIGVSDVRQKNLKRRLESQRSYFEQADGIFTMGNWLAEYLVASCGVSANKVHYAGGGSNLEFIPYPQKLKHEAPVFLFVGRDFERKGGHDVVCAFSKIKEKLPAAKLLIVGPKQNPCAEHIEGVDWLGDLSNGSISNLFGKSDVFVMPSYFEAFGIVFAEALSCGIPCVGRSRYEMRYFIKDGVNGALVQSNSIEELADAMLRCVNDPRIRRGAYKGRDSAITDYSWDTVANRIASAIDEDA